MRIVMLGPPGSGKSTQGSFLAEKYQVPEISVGDMLRAEVQNQTDLGKKIKKIMDKGELVSDFIVLDRVQERINQPDCANGYLFDDFPRTLVQVGKMRERDIRVDLVVVLDVPDDVIIERFRTYERELAPAHGFHVVYNLPGHTEEISDEDRTIQEDEGVRLLRKQLHAYHSHTQPLVDYFYKWALFHDPDSPTFVRVDGTGEVEQVHNRIVEALGEEG